MDKHVFYCFSLLIFYHLSGEKQNKMQTSKLSFTDTEAFATQYHSYCDVKA